MYKYFSTKEDLFITCLQRGMKILDDILDDIMASDDKILVKAEKVIAFIQRKTPITLNYIMKSAQSKTRRWSIFLQRRLRKVRAKNI